MEGDQEAAPVSSQVQSQSMLLSFQSIFIKCQLCMRHCSGVEVTGPVLALDFMFVVYVARVWLEGRL